MDRCTAQGAALVVRVNSDPSRDIGFTIIPAILYRGKGKVATGETMGEAERVTP